MTTLASALPELQQAYQQLYAYAQSQGITIGIADFGGVRTQADTTKILQYRQDDYDADLRAGRIPAGLSLQRYRPISPYGSSYHNYGAAFDVNIIARPSSMSVDQARQVLANYAPSIGLRWGGTFKNPDPPHFELAISLDDARQRYAALTGGAQSVSSALDNLAKFVPFITDSVDQPLPDVTTADLSGDATDDSGDVAIAANGNGNQTTLIFAGLALVGVMLWAIRRKFLT